MTTELFNSRPFNEEDFAEWLDGNLSPEEELDFLQNSENDPFLAELLDANDQIDAAYELLNETGYELPQQLFTDFELPALDEVQTNFAQDDFGDTDFQPDIHEEETQDDTDNPFGPTSDSDLTPDENDHNADDDYDCMAF